MSDNPQKCKAVNVGGGEEDEQGPEVDTRRLLAIFPEEVWEKILDKVTEVDALDNLNSASAFFKTRLLGKRTLYLFPKVWPILYPTLETELKDDSFEFDVMELFNIHNDPQEFSDILKLRQVCKAWCSGVDSLCRQQAALEEDSWSTVEFETPSTVHAFLEHFEDTHGVGEGVESKNPFLGRSICLSWNYQTDSKMKSSAGTSTNDSESGWSGKESRSEGEEEDSGSDNEWVDIASSEEGDAANLQLLLQKYGAHVWYCSIFIYDKSAPSRECYWWLTTMLNLLPNLKILGIGFRENVHEDFEWDSVGAEDFPKLEQLEYLSVDNLCGALLEGMLKQNGHIKRLQVVGYRNGKDFEYEIISAVSSNLKQLHLEIREEEDFEALMNLETTWPLEELNLEFVDGVETPWKEIFQGISKKWANTLVDLDMNIPESDEMDESKPMAKDLELKLNLPKLKRLKIYMTNYRWLDFLLPMKDTLEDLHVCVSLPPVWSMKGDAKIPKHELEKHGKGRLLLELLDEPVTSIIWGEMPKLKRIYLSETYYENGHHENKRSFHGQQTRRQWANGEQFSWEVQPGAQIWE